MDNCPCCFQVLPERMELEVSLDHNCVMWKGIRCDLSPTETEYMHVLVKYGFRWVHIDSLVEGVYGHSDHPSNSCVRVHMTHIRRKLRDKQIPVIIAHQGGGAGGTQKYRLEYG